MARPGVFQEVEATRFSFNRHVRVICQLQSTVTFTLQKVLLIFSSVIGGPGSVATAYGLDGPGMESRWGRDFPQLSRPTLRSTEPPVKWVPGLFRGWCAAGA